MVLEIAPTSHLPSSILVPDSLRTASFVTSVISLVSDPNELTLFPATADTFFDHQFPLRNGFDICAILGKGKRQTECVRVFDSEIRNQVLGGDKSQSCLPHHAVTCPRMACQFENLKRQLP